MNRRIVCVALVLITIGAAVRHCAAASGVTGRELRPDAGGLVSAVDAPARGGDQRWRPSPGSVEAPAGNPLTDPLALSAAQRRMLADAEDGRLDEHTLIDAALVACGADDAANLRCRAKFAALAEELRRAAAHINSLSPGGRGQGEGEARKIELIHRALYDRLLRTYDADATDLVGAFDSGVYNCASATLLFVALADEINLHATAVELPGHVRAVVECGGRRCEIEVTCPEWPAAAHWIEAASNPSPFQGEGRVRVAAPSITDLKPDLNRRDVPPAGLVAMIYYNRGIDAFYEHRFAEAVAANRRALLLDADNPVARGNLLAAVNNWALALCDAGKFQAAEALLAAGRRFAPDHAPFAHNASHVERMRAHAAVATGQPSG